jgi:hypothetical protein
MSNKTIECKCGYIATFAANEKWKCPECGREWAYAASLKAGFYQCGLPDSMLIKAMEINGGSVSC